MKSLNKTQNDIPSEQLPVTKEEMVELASKYRNIEAFKNCDDETTFWYIMLFILSKYIEYKSKYRIPDIIIDPKSAIKRVLPELTQIDGARRIGKHMFIGKNSSHSFHVFVDGVRNLCMEKES